MRQGSFSELEYDHKHKLTRRDRFLAEIDAVTPWSVLVAEIETYYPKGEGRGRPPIGCERMLRMYLAQQCFGLSDEGMEDALYDSQAIRRFVGIDLTRERAPDATTLLKFRRLLEQHGLTRRLLETLNGHLAAKGLFMRTGTVVDATLIAAPSSTKNKKGERDPEMHQAKKGKQYYFGMKVHVGADMDSGLVHSLVGTAANVSDVTRAHELLHGDEEVAFGDAGYQGAHKRPEADPEHAVDWQVAMRPGKRRQLDRMQPLDKLKDEVEKLKASIRAKVEHPFQVVKQRFGYRKVRYRGLAKNTAQLYTLFALANLVRVRKQLLAFDG